MCACVREYSERRLRDLRWDFAPPIRMRGCARLGINKLCLATAAVATTSGRTRVSNIFYTSHESATHTTTINEDNDKQKKTRVYKLGKL